MQAIILAAGMGKRLKELTQNNTKCMVEVNGISLIERLLKTLDTKKLSKIIIVIGYKAKALEQFVNSLNIITPIKFIDNPVYEKTNNIYSLSLASHYLELEDSLLFESDLIFEEKIVDRLLCDKRENLVVVDKYESWMDGTCMLLDNEYNIQDFIPGQVINYSNKDNYYKTVNIYKFSKEFSRNIYLPFLEAYRKVIGENEYYESIIKIIASLNMKDLKGFVLEEDEIWYEIDDKQDLDIAETLFTQDSKEKYKKIIERYGGYWRYPKLLDFCYLVNPYFPSQRMLEEMNSNFNTLIKNYPSGMDVNCLLASKNFGVEKSKIVIGNGAAELIKILMNFVCVGNIGMVLPTFEEYINCNKRNTYIFYKPNNDTFCYDENDLIGFFDNKEINTLLLINPDNPSGNYIAYEGLLKLLNWTRKKNIKLVLDESFVDFVNTHEKKSLLDKHILDMYSNLYVIKSISKSFGIPGIRIGVLASSDEKNIGRIKNTLSIWNINSFAEFFLQIFSKYEVAYKKSLTAIINARNKFETNLKMISYLRVIHSEANYITCEVIDGILSEELAAYLLNENILIKDLTKKVSNGRQYIRLAVRSEEDNNFLINKLMNGKLFLIN